MEPTNTHQCIEDGLDVRIRRPRYQGEHDTATLTIETKHGTTFAYEAWRVDPEDGAGSWSRDGKDFTSEDLEDLHGLGRGDVYEALHHAWGHIQ